MRYTFFICLLCAFHAGWAQDIPQRLSVSDITARIEQAEDLLQKGNTPQAARLYLNLLQQPSLLPDKESEARIFGKLGDLYRDAAFYERAINCYQSALAIEETKSDRSTLLHLHTELLTCAKALGNTTLELQHAHARLSAGLSPGDSSGYTGEIVADLSHALVRDNKSDSAMHFLMPAWKRSKNQGDKNSELLILREIITNPENKIKPGLLLKYCDTLQSLSRTPVDTTLSNWVKGWVLVRGGKKKAGMVEIDSALTRILLMDSLPMRHEWLQRTSELFRSAGNLTEANRIDEILRSDRDSLDRAQKEKWAYQLFDLQSVVDKPEPKESEYPSWLARFTRDPLIPIFALVCLALFITLGVMVLRLSKRNQTIQKLLKEQSVNTESRTSDTAKSDEEYRRQKEESRRLKSMLELQDRERITLGKSIGQIIAQPLKDSRTRLESLAREAGTAIPVGTYMELNNLLARTSQDVQRLAADLNPDETGQSSLTEQLRTLCSRFSSGTQTVSFQVSGVPDKQDRSRDNQIIRIVYELLSNSSMHSGATQCEVILEWKQGQPWIEVTDNGGGFDLRAKMKSDSGLASVLTRASYLGGKVEVESASGKGTRISVVY